MIVTFNYHTDDIDDIDDILRFSDSKAGGGPTLHQRMEICKSQAHLQMLTSKIENVWW